MAMRVTPVTDLNPVICGPDGGLTLDERVRVEEALPRRANAVPPRVARAVRFGTLTVV
jgi:hypothetical protein